MECGDQVLRNFLNGLVIHLRGTKENPKNAMDVIKQNQENVKQNTAQKKTFSPKSETEKTTTSFKKKPASNSKFKDKKTTKIQVVEKVKFKNGKDNKK